MVKKWGSLNGFKVSWVYTTQKNHETYVSYVSDLILSHYCLADRCILVHILNFTAFFEVSKVHKVQNSLIMPKKNVYHICN